MPYLTLDFEWTRGTGYAIEEVADRDALEAQPDLPSPAWADRRRYKLVHPAEYGEWDDVGALWHARSKDGGIIRRQESPGLGRGDLIIRQTSELSEKVKPLDLRPTLFADFAKLDGSPQACLKFAGTWGLLFSPAKKGAVETLAQWHRAIREVQGWIFALDLDNDGRHSAAKESRQYELTMVGIHLLAGGLVLRPLTLLDGMLVQLAQIANTGGGLRECQQCGTYFEVGSDKRADAKFCSDRCRNRFNYERRRQ